MKQATPKKHLIKTSKYIALILRHKPECVGLTLDSKGRVKINDLIKAMNLHSISINREMLDEIVETNDKKRYVIDGEYIYAAQGHSIEVNVELDEKEPPDILYHGTAIRNLSSIFKEGIQHRDRNYVHLSSNIETAIKVGARHGEPNILIVDSKRMYKDGHKFYISKNNVWLVDYVPKEYITAQHPFLIDN
jgi:putative RNA 2'-phosphotransferase